MKLKISITLAILFVLSFWIYRWISSLPVSSTRADPGVPLTVASGEALFWGKGTCHICHRVGERGDALRGPNLGFGKDGPPVANRAVMRASDLGLATPTAYLVQSLMEPAAFTVHGYRAEMPEVFKAPVSLFPSEIKAIIRYLQSTSGDTSYEAIELPLKYWQTSEPRTVTSGFAGKGNIRTGRQLFFDAAGAAACASCHQAIDSTGAKSGSDIGPDLSDIAQIRTPEYLYWKIVKPDSNRVSGYDEMILKTKDGRHLSGLIKEISGDMLVLRVRTGEVLEISMRDIASRRVSETSPMPGNYADLLTRKQIQDLVAFLSTPQASINSASQ